MSSLTFERVVDGLAAVGLRCRGAFHPTPNDRVPGLPPGTPATLVLAGSVGGSLWPAFSTAPELADGQPDALDRWSRRVLDDVARELGPAPAVQALFPFGGPPYLPFVAWAKRAEPVRESPLGMLIHPEHGLWHAYRGALLILDHLDLPATPEAEHPCEACVEKPCLSACPVGAFDGTLYDVQACAGHVSSAAGASCIEQGCAARLACPVGRDGRYDQAQQRFHMSAFLRARLQAAQDEKPEGTMGDR